jgi:hypothetical protein
MQMKSRTKVLMHCVQNRWRASCRLSVNARKVSGWADMKIVPRQMFARSFLSFFVTVRCTSARMRQSCGYRNVPAPQVAIDYWKLAPGSLLREVIVTIRADETRHRVSTNSLLMN